MVYFRHPYNLHQVNTHKKIYLNLETVTLTLVFDVFISDFYILNPAQSNSFFPQNSIKSILRVILSRQESGFKIISRTFKKPVAYMNEVVTAELYNRAVIIYVR